MITIYLLTMYIKLIIHRYYLTLIIHRYYLTLIIHRYYLKIIRRYINRDCYYGMANRFNQ
jgi:hypothetical protein